jgi:predicted kinase
MRRSRLRTLEILLKHNNPTLFIFGGLPATGKSTLAAALAKKLEAVYIRIDTIEQALRNAGAPITGPEGYIVGYTIAAENLKLGRYVVSDSVNPVELTRAAWRAVAADSGCSFVEIEVVCSDRDEHQNRVETRAIDVEGLKLPRWNDVVTRDYEPWPGQHLILDTAGKTIDQSFWDFLSLLKVWQ